MLVFLKLKIYRPFASLTRGTENAEFFIVFSPERGENTIQQPFGQKQPMVFNIVDIFIRIPPVESPSALRHVDELMSSRSGPKGLKVERLSGNWGPACGDSERREENSDKFLSLCPPFGSEPQGRRLRLCGEIVFGQVLNSVSFRFWPRFRGEPDKSNPALSKILRTIDKGLFGNMLKQVF